MMSHGVAHCFRQALGCFIPFASQHTHGLRAPGHLANAHSANTVIPLVLKGATQAAGVSNSYTYFSKQVGWDW